MNNDTRSPRGACAASGGRLIPLEAVTIRAAANAKAGLMRRIITPRCRFRNLCSPMDAAAPVSSIRCQASTDIASPQTLVRLLITFALRPERPPRCDPALKGVSVSRIFSGSRCLSVSAILVAATLSISSTPMQAQAQADRGTERAWSCLAGSVTRRFGISKHDSKSGVRSGHDSRPVATWRSAG